MRLHSWIAALLLCGVTAHAHALSAPRPGQVIEVALEQLHPTQAVVGFDQIYYSLGLFAAKPAKVFDEYCETNGQGEAKKVPKKADLHHPESFTCEDPVGAHPDEMKTVVVGPGGQLYLTDGHHSFTTLWEVPGGGARLKMWVRVTDDFSSSPDMNTFWQRMAAARKVWLKDSQGRTLAPEQLPAHLGFKHLQNDTFRSLVYFTRKAAYGKPDDGEIAPEFLEFYWGDWLRTQIDLSQYNLDSKGGYKDAIEAVAKRMVSLAPGSKVGDSGFTAHQLGGMSELDRKALEKTFDNKVPYIFDYRKSLR
ncbi:ParB/Srx family N-terminal domain-containing protein [Pseudomonas sp. MH9.3]|uniref:ParB/Srx family N-terminal domain-containing protein n=1 Tax=Pseudomonas sp. MH9.3 TaxID=3048630 RepID=UPI002AC9DD11|nr:ParB/Srx family N-terminal domain-containing protein [Pseudomonas sp. MH9.3]MEB0108594.1 ParB/Srx family N-terminal domain-containing protein [Pseudomonas sp. MH9.3]WPX79196.1 ParB/Srx family N-terminal domain-containing protein [Pseudomonas sp. MH9.3]WQG58553.1 ParB/Srx family N-terminal domain-containing protein [Pseudomonas sp. RTB3]